DDVVEPPFEQLQQRDAGDAAGAFRFLEVAAKLILEHAVDALHLLLLAQLQAVAGELRLPRLAVLARREVALLDRALLRVAALTLEEQLHRLAATETADRTDITSHSISSHWRSAILRSAISIADHPIARSQITRVSASAAGIRCAESASRRESTSLPVRPSAARGSPTRGRSRAPSRGRRAIASRPSSPHCRRSAPPESPRTASPCATP